MATHPKKAVVQHLKKAPAQASATSAEPAFMFDGNIFPSYGSGEESPEPLHTSLNKSIASRLKRVEDQVEDQNRYLRKVLTPRVDAISDTLDELIQKIGV